MCRMIAPHSPAPSSPRPVRKAVVPAAGLGIRFLPATKATPKEMLPVVDKPAITETEARAHCETVADQTYPSGSNSGDETLDGITDAYSATMHEKTFQQCMDEQGYPQ